MRLTLTEWLILAVTALLLWGGHHFPWHIIPGLTDGKGNLPRPAAYVFGVGCILAGLACWCAYLGDWSWFWRVGFLALAAGVGTTLPRIVKREDEFQARGKDEADRGQTYGG